MILARCSILGPATAVFRIIVMKNTTISIDENILNDGRKHAQSLGLSFNAWLAKLIQGAVRRTSSSNMQALLTLSDRIAGSSEGKRWSRDEIYDR